MALERTLSIIKPDAVKKNVIGQIIARFEKAGPARRRGAHDASVARRGRGLLRRASRAPVLQGPGRFHDFRAGAGAGARRRQRDREEPRADGRDRPEEGGEGHHPRRLRDSIDANAVHGSDSAGERAHRSRLFLPGMRGLRDGEQPARARRRRARSASSRSRARSRSAPARCCAGSTSGGERDFAAHERPGQGAAREARRDRRASRRRRSSATRSRPTARASGCSRSTARTRSRRCSSRRRNRGTLCISSQAGCVLDCAFCSTGKQGFNRNLSTAEIVGQLWLANRCSTRRPAGSAIDHQRRDDGHGRAAPQPRQRRSRRCG